MKKLINLTYSIIETIRYVLTGASDPLRRPLFLMPKPIRFFIKKYGANFGHYDFKSTSTRTQIEFLEDYREYLKYIRPNIKYMVINRDKRIMKITNNSQSRYSLGFSEAGEPVFTYSGKDGSSGAGRLSLTFELNL